MKACDHTAINRARLARRVCALASGLLMAGTGIIAVGPRIAMADPDNATYLFLDGIVQPVQGGEFRSVPYEAMIQPIAFLGDPDGNGIPNEPITLTVGRLKTTCITNSFGEVLSPACDLRNTLPLGSYTFRAAFAGDPSVPWMPSADFGKFQSTKGFASIDLLNGPTTFQTNTTITWTMNLHEDYGDTGPGIRGQRLVGTLSSTDFRQTQRCLTPPTNAAGTTTCTIHVTQPPNPDETIDFNFRGSKLFFFTTAINGDAVAQGTVLP